jgi:hypothetical protein
MGQFDDLVEQRIRNAMADGSFDDLPGRGRPLRLDDDALVPEDMRLAYRVLKNAGYLPEALALRREISDIQVLVDRIADADERCLANKRLALLRTRLAACAGERPLHLDGEYLERVRRRLGGSL